MPVRASTTAITHRRTADAKDHGVRWRLHAPTPKASRTAAAVMVAKSRPYVPRKRPPGRSVATPATRAVGGESDGIRRIEGPNGDPSPRAGRLPRTGAFFGKRAPAVPPRFQVARRSVFGADGGDPNAHSPRNRARKARNGGQGEEGRQERSVHRDRWSRGVRRLRNP